MAKKFVPTNIWGKIRYGHGTDNLMDIGWQNKWIFQLSVFNGYECGFNPHPWISIPAK
jgi:hypothetical protein